MNIKIKSSLYFNEKQNQDYTFIFDADSESSIFVSNSLLKELSYKRLGKYHTNILGQIEIASNNGICSEENIEKGIFIRNQKEFNKVFKNHKRK